VNPAHLYLGTVVENVQDSMERGRHHRPPRKTHCPTGHEYAGSNLRLVQAKGGEKRVCRTCDNRRSNERQTAARAARGLLKTRLADHERATIRDLREAGATQRSIAADLGRALATVQKCLKEMAA